MRSVRDAAFDVLRQHGMTMLFGNPGSTEVPLLTDLPPDLQLVLALHEGSVVGAATGWALVRDEPALALLHTTAGLGNAVGALATARVNRAPVVAVVGQQDRRHLVQEPFLAGRLEGLAGEYPLGVETPPRAQDVPGALARAAHTARVGRGPALVVVPSGDWAEPAEELPLPSPAVLRTAVDADASAAAELAAMLARADSPALLVGAGADRSETWAALVEVAERLGCPVLQEPFGARAGFPQDHPCFAGHLPADRGRLREVLASYDLVVAVGAPVVRQYPYEDGALAPPDTRLALVTDDLAEARRSPAALAYLAPLAEFTAALAAELPARTGPLPRTAARPAPPLPPPEGHPLYARHVLAALAERLPAETVLVEEAPSDRSELHARVPARAPLGFLSAAMGGLGFALPAAVGVRMGAPRRPVVAVVGDGSSLYQIQALWTAAHYGVGVLVVVLANGGYRVLDRLAEREGGEPPWPSLHGVDVAGLARSLGCEARRVGEHEALERELDAAVPELAGRTSPLVLEVAVEAERDFRP